MEDIRVFHKEGARKMKRIIPILLILLFLTPVVSGFGLDGARKWIVGLGDNRLNEDHTSSSIFIASGTSDTYEIRGKYPLNYDPSNDYVLLLLLTTNDTGTVSGHWSCEGDAGTFQQFAFLGDFVSDFHGQDIDDLENLSDGDNIGGVLRLPPLDGETLAFLINPQRTPLQTISPESTDQYSNSDEELSSAEWWQSCTITSTTGDIWVTGTVLRNKEDFIERHFSSLNHEFDAVADDVYTTVDTVDDLFYSFIITIGIILVIFIFVFIWKTFEYFINQSRRV
jgi:hypothetical protein